MSEEASIRRDVAFGSEGADLKGWVYVPDSAPPWPLVVMAHGFSATRHMTAGKYAEVFRAAGLAVLLYDHRGFGDSGGEPRRQINPWIQARGYRDAVSYARSLEGVDDSRVAIRGDSFSGGVALAVAGIDGRVAALVVQVPALGREPPPADPEALFIGLSRRRSSRVLWSLLRGISEVLRRWSPTTRSADPRHWNRSRRIGGSSSTEGASGAVG